jgi:hypothetical protein
MSSCGIDSSRKHSTAASSDNSNINYSSASHSSDTYLDGLAQTDIYSAVLYRHFAPWGMVMTSAVNATGQAGPGPPHTYMFVNCRPPSPA